MPCKGLQARVRRARAASCRPAPDGPSPVRGMGQQRPAGRVVARRRRHALPAGLRCRGGSAHAEAGSRGPSRRPDPQAQVQQWLRLRERWTWLGRLPPGVGTAATSQPPQHGSGIEIGGPAAHETNVEQAD
jgi:hypothetical protein